MNAALVCLALLAAQPAPAPAPPTPKTFTLSANQTKLSAVLADLAKQTGVPLDDKRGGDDDPITLNLKDQTFWQAVDAVADAAHARLEINPRDGHVTLVKRKEKEPLPISRDGLFRASVKRITAAHDFDTGDSADTAAIEIAWEAHLLPLYLETQPHNFKIVDEAGKGLPATAVGSNLAPVDGRTSFLLELPLPALDRSAKKIGQLQGTLKVIAPSRMLQLKFDPLDQLDVKVKAGTPATVTQDGMKCTIAKVVLNNDRWSVTVKLNYPPGGPELESYQSWVVNNEMTLESTDGKGKLLTSNSYSLDAANARNATVTYHFTAKNRGKPDEWNLLYRTPASIVELPFTFSFKDIRLP